MSELKFKTSLKCDGCVASVTPGLNAIPSVEKWEVDLTSPEKTLIVTGENLKEDEIIAALQKAGYKAEKKS